MLAGVPEGARACGVEVAADASLGSPALRLTLKVNGDTRQDASSGGMTWGVDELLRFVDERSSFECGDVLFTGSPEGTGQGTGRFLKIGDVVEASIDGIGKLRNVVTAA